MGATLRNVLWTNILLIISKRSLTLLCNTVNSKFLKFLGLLLIIQAVNTITNLQEMDQLMSLPNHMAVKKFMASYETRRVTKGKSANEPLEYSQQPHTAVLQTILILSFHQLISTKWSLPITFSEYSQLLNSNACYMYCPFNRS